MKKRFWALFLAVMMVVSVLPTSAFAEEAVTPVTSVGTDAENPVQITKSVTANDNGTYTIDMEAFVTGSVETTNPAPLDIVLVLDVSGSMKDDITIVTSSTYKKVTDSTNGIVYLFFQYGDQVYYYLDNGEYYPVESIWHEGGIGLLTDTYYCSYEKDGTDITVTLGSSISLGTLYQITATRTTVSKMEALQEAVKAFISQTAEKNAAVTDADDMHRISIVKFAGTSTNTVGNNTYKSDGYEYNYSQIVKNLTAVNEAGAAELTAAVNALEAAGATSADYGLNHAKTVLANSTREKVIIFFTDGEPNHGSGFNTTVANTAIDYASDLKDDGATIYTVGVLAGADPDDTRSNINKYLHAVSSNYPDAKSLNNMGNRAEDSDFYKVATTEGGLEAIFGEIAEEMIPAVSAGEDSILMDTISEWFLPVVPENATGVSTALWSASGTGAEPTWTEDEDCDVTAEISGQEVTVTGFDYSANPVIKTNDGWTGLKLVISFTIEPDVDAEWEKGTNLYPTNVAGENEAGNAGLIYGDAKAELTESPEVVVSAYTVTYTITGDVPEDYTAPTGGVYLPGAEVEVEDDPEVAGYAFEGWKIDDEDAADFIMPSANVELTGVWSKSTYTVFYKYTGEVPTDAPAVPSPEEVPAEETYTVADKPTLNGYVFDGWKMDNKIVTDFEMPDSNVELTGSWSLGKYGYTVEYYFDGEQDEDLTEELEAVFDAVIDSYPIKAGDGYCLDYATAPITIGADASKNVIKVYYAKDVWNDETNEDDMGDGIPDKYQVCVKYVSNDPEKGTVTKKNDTPALDVITLYDAAGAYATAGDVTTSEATATATEGNGFKNWTDYNGFEMAAEDETLSAQTIEGAEGGETYTYTAIFSAATQPGVVKIPYYIEHYQEQLDGTYVKAETETKFDVNEKEITIADADYKAYANYTPNKTHKDAVLNGTVGVSVDIIGDAPVATMLTLKLYYDLDEYTVTYEVDGEPVGEAETYQFGAEVTVKDEPAQEGYDFFGWSYDPEVEVNEEGKFTMPAANVTISGYFLQHCTVKASKDMYQLLDAEGKQFWPVELEGDAEQPRSTIETVAIPAVKAGETIIWKITVVNVGDQPGEFMLNELLAGVQVFADEACTEPVDLTQTFAIGAQGDNEATEYSVDFFAKYTVQEKDVAEIINKITVSGSEEPIVAPGVDVANIAVTKTADKTDVKVGDKVTYTITVKNEGTVDLADVKVTDTFVAGGKGTLTVKSGNLEVGKLAAGETATIVLEYTTVAGDVNGLKNTAVAEGFYDGEKTVGESDTEEVKVTKKNDPVKPVGPSKPALNKADHYAYIVGYPDGLVHPEKNITRAEVSTIFFRMLLDESREDFWAQENWFSDVPAHMWFNNAVSTLANAGLITGYPDGSFKPNANITRAEFATIAIRFFLEEDVEITENNLSDVKGHWAEANINLAYALNLINGYPDNTFRPDQKITRAEAMTIVNRVLERAPEKDHLLDDMIEWPDNMNKDAWYYAAVQEATNSHEFYRDSKNEHEVWTELLPVRDWAALEREWSQANSSKNPGEVVDINISTPEAGN